MSEAIKTRASFRFIMITIVLLMGAMYAYMTFVMKTVPKSVTNSRAGPFVGLVDELLKERQDSRTWTQGEDASLRAVNQRLQELIPQGGLQLSAGQDWTPMGWQERKLNGRPLLSIRLSKAGSDDILLAFFPLAKRNFPKTGGFAEGQAWFFVFGKDHDVAQHPKHQEEVHRLKQMNLNLVATNYGNDYFIMLLSPLDSKQLAKELFKLTTIFQVSPGSF